MTLPARSWSGATEVLDPFTGELVDVSDPQVAAEFLDALRGSKDAIDRVIRTVTDIITSEFQRQGSKTIAAGRWELELSPSVTYQWDEEELQKLLDAGLPEERYQDLVQTTVSVKVRQNVAKQLESSNDEYAAIIEQARTRVEGAPRVNVKRLTAELEQ